MQEDNSIEKFFKSAHSPTWKLNQEKQTKKKKKNPNMPFILEGVLFGNLIDCYFWFYHEKDFSAYSDLEYRPSLED